MAMHFDMATKRQLLTIALHEDCSLDLKYEALRELQLRKFSDVHLQKLVKLWGMGATQERIAELLDADFETVGYYLRKYGLYRVRREGKRHESKRIV